MPGFRLRPEEKSKQFSLHCGKYRVLLKARCPSNEAIADIPPATMGLRRDVELVGYCTASIKQELSEAVAKLACLLLKEN